MKSELKKLCQVIKTLKEKSEKENEKVYSQGFSVVGTPSDEIFEMCCRMEEMITIDFLHATHISKL